MASEYIPDHAVEVKIADVREGERVLVEYRSAQSGNRVHREGEVVWVEQSGVTTRSFKVAAENGTTYRITNHSYVRSTGDKSRKLSRGRATVYLLESLDIETWSDRDSFGAVHITREKSEVFDCPNCGARDSAAITSINDDSVTVSCGTCRKVQTLPEQPTTMALKVAR